MELFFLFLNYFSICHLYKIFFHRPIPAPTNGNEATTGGMNEKCDEKTRSLERWPDNPEHGSPIPRPLGRQKRVSEPAVSVAGVAASSATGGGPSWQIDLNKVIIYIYTPVPQFTR